MSKNTKNEYMRESRPELETLYQRATQWREEIGIKTRPDMEQAKEALRLSREAGIEEEVVLFVVALCEWTFRIQSPLPLHIRRALRFKLNHEGYSPYLLDQFRTKGVPPLVDQYVDSRLRNLWNQHASEQSRILLGEKIENLGCEFSKPSQAAGFIQKPPRKGGYSWLAPWVACTILYEWLRELYPRKRDSRPLDASLALAQALLGRIPDQAQFHRKSAKL